MVPRTSHQLVVEAIMSEIVGGRFRPGDALPIEPELCTKFSVSRSVIREAIKTLSAKGIVAPRPKTGTRVEPQDRWSLFDPQVVAWRLQNVDDALVRDLMEIRLIIETEAAALAARRATAADIQVLNDAVAGMAAANDGAEALEPDLDFHRGLVRAAHNQFLSQLIPAIIGILRLSLELSLTTRERLAVSVPLHAAVADAIERRKPEVAREATRRLIARALLDIKARKSGRSRNGTRKTGNAARGR